MKIAQWGVITCDTERPGDMWVLPHCTVTPSHYCHSSSVNNFQRGLVTRLRLIRGKREINLISKWNIADQSLSLELLRKYDSKIVFHQWQVFCFFENTHSSTNYFPARFERDNLPGINTFKKTKLIFAWFYYLHLTLVGGMLGRGKKGKHSTWQLKSSLKRCKILLFCYQGRP